MKNQEPEWVEKARNIVQEEHQNTKIEVQVERFPVVKAKFSKEVWDSGEGGGEGEGEGEGEG